MSAEDSQPPFDPGTLLVHRAWMARMARALVHGDADAEDIEQQAWLDLLERPPARAPRSPREWLWTVLRFKAVDRTRSEAARRRREEGAARSEASGSSPPDILARAEAADRVVHAVLELEEPQRRTVLLRYFEGLPPREIALRQGVPVETVRTRLKRALAALRLRLDEEKGGDRRAWALLLLPPATGRGRTTGGAASAVVVMGGWLVSRKALAGAAAALLLLAGFLLLDREDAPGGKGIVARAPRPLVTRRVAAPPEEAPPSPEATERESPGAPHELLLRDALTGAPVEGVEVAWRCGGSSGAGTSKGDGSLALPRQEEGPIRLLTRKEGYDPGECVQEAATWDAPVEVLLVPDLSIAAARFLRAARRREEFLKRARVTMTEMTWSLQSMHLVSGREVVADFADGKERWVRRELRADREGVDLPYDADGVPGELAGLLREREPHVTVYDGKRQVDSWLEPGVDGVRRWKGNSQGTIDPFFRRGGLVWSGLRLEHQWLSELASTWTLLLVQPAPGERVNWLFTSRFRETTYVMRVQTAGGAEMLPVLEIWTQVHEGDLPLVIERFRDSIDTLEPREELLTWKQVPGTVFVDGILLPASSGGRLLYKGKELQASTRYWLSYEARDPASWPAGWFDPGVNPDPSLCPEGVIYDFEEGGPGVPMGEPDR